MFPALISITPDPSLHLGPISLPWYGIGYAVGIGFATWLTARLAPIRGIDRRHVYDVLLYVVVFGLLGARLYHVIDQWELYRDDLLAIVLPPYSGLGVFGGIAGGLFGAWIYLRRQGIPFLRAVDLGMPGLLFAQAIARFGNFFNQELYGPPTDLPWGIAIDCAHRVEQWPCATFPLETTGFQPLFLYESLLSLIGGLIAYRLITRHDDRLRDGDLLSFWLIWYGAARIVLETFREGYNWTLGGLPVASLIGILAVIAGIATIAYRRRSPAPDPALRRVPVTYGAPTKVGPADQDDDDEWEDDDDGEWEDVEADVDEEAQPDQRKKAPDS